MHESFVSLVQSYASATGILCEFHEAEQMAVLSVEDGYPLIASYFTDDDLLVLQAPLGALYGDTAERCRIFEAVLEANNGFGGTSGACIGYDPEAALLTLQWACPMERMGTTELDAFVKNFLAIALSWIEKIAHPQEWLDQAPQVDTEESHQDMIRI